MSLNITAYIARNIYVAVATARNAGNVKSVQNCTGSIFCTFHATVRIRGYIDHCIL